MPQIEKPKKTHQRLYSGGILSKSPQVVIPPRFEDVKSPDFKSVFVNGVFGGLDPNEGRILFFLDHIEPKTLNEPVPGSQKVEKITRDSCRSAHESDSV
jgi:hypothetical protein